MGKFFKFIKNNWFVCLLVLIFAGSCTYYIYDSNKGKLRGKSSGGEDVVYSINGKDTTASQFYDDLYDDNGISAIYNMLAKEVGNQSVEATDDMKSNASSQASTIISNYQSSYPSNYKEQLGDDLKQMGYSGYDDLETFLVDYQKEQQVTADYAKANFDDLQIRYVNYILIKFTDSDNPTDDPTEDEQTRMDAVDTALADGTSFSDAAISYSEDSSTASSGGAYGVIDKNTSSLDASFLSASLALKEGETSDWIRSDSYGYFKIQCTAATPETLEANYSTDEDPYLSLISNNDTTLMATAIWEKAQELGLDFKGNTDLETSLKTYMGIADDTADTTATAELTADASAEATADASASAEATATAEGN